MQRIYNCFEKFWYDISLYISGVTSPYWSTHHKTVFQACDSYKAMLYQKNCLWAVVYSVYGVLKRQQAMTRRFLATIHTTWTGLLVPFANSAEQLLKESLPRIAATAALCIAFMLGVDTQKWYRYWSQGPARLVAPHSQENGRGEENWFWSSWASLSSGCATGNRLW